MLSRFHLKKWFFPAKKVESPSPLEKRAALVKARPERMAPPNYQLVQVEAAVDQHFERLKKYLHVKIQETRKRGIAPKYRFEAGKLGVERPYFFLQPWDDTGYLFERIPHGWSVSRAEKIEATSTFLRRYEPWDVANLYQNGEPQGLVRVASQRLDAQLASFLIYEAEVAKWLELT
ncbi:MAG: hypothetical protein AB7T49_06485 [Oligoflexales bacterium]